MKILYELSIAWEIFKFVVSFPVEWYKMARKRIIVSRCIKTPEGRRKLAEAMVEPMQRTMFH